MFRFDTLKIGLRNFADAQTRLWAGAAFMALAMLAIEYDEIIAPEVSRLSEGWSAATTDLKSMLASFTL